MRSGCPTGGGRCRGVFRRHVVRGGWWRGIPAEATAPAWLPALFLPSTRLCAEQYLVWLAAVGMDEETFAAAHWLPSSPRTPSPRSVAR